MIFPKVPLRLCNTCSLSWNEMLSVFHTAKNSDNGCTSLHPSSIGSLRMPCLTPAMQIQYWDQAATGINLSSVLCNRPVPETIWLFFLHRVKHLRQRTKSCCLLGFSTDPTEVASIGDFTLKSLYSTCCLRRSFTSPSIWFICIIWLISCLLKSPVGKQQWKRVHNAHNSFICHDCFWKTRWKHLEKPRRPVAWVLWLYLEEM